MTTEPKVPASCVIGDQARLHPTVQLGEGVIISGEVELQEGVQVGHHCILEGAPGRRTSIGANTALADFVRIHPGVSLGANCRVGAFSILGHPTKADLTGRDPASGVARVQNMLIPEPTTVIEADALIRSHAVIYTHVRIGISLSTGHGIMIREHTTIGDHCVFGTHASTDGYCWIGPWAHIGQYCQLSQAARLEQGVFIGGHTVFSDNRQAIRSVDEDLFGATIGAYARIGLNCIILPAVRVRAGALVGAGSVVTKDIPERVLAYGSPARVIRELTNDEVMLYVASV